MLPFIDFFGVKISSYGLCMLAAIIFVVLLSAKEAKKRQIQFEDVIVISAFILAFFVFGAGLLYTVVTYSFEDIVSQIKKGDFIFIKNVGLVFYGGLLFGILGAFIGARVTRVSIKNAEEIFVPYIPLGHAIGRVGCFLAGCCRGMEYDGFLSIQYSRSIFPEETSARYFPTQILESVLNVILFVCLSAVRKRKRKPFDLLFIYLLEYSVMRFFVEFLRGDSIRGLYWKLSTSQWISIFLILISSIYFITKMVYLKKLKYNKEK